MSLKWTKGNHYKTVRLEFYKFVQKKNDKEILTFCKNEKMGLFFNKLLFYTQNS